MRSHRHQILPAIFAKLSLRFIGSNNALNWKSRGMTGVIANGSCRDTDELILQRIPVYSQYLRFS